MFAKPVEKQSIGTYFKPAQWADAAGLLIEPISFRPQVEGNFGVEDIVTAHVTVFNEDGKFKVLDAQAITNGPLVDSIKTLIGEKLFQKLGQGKSKKGNSFWKFEDVTDAELVEKVMAYVNKRDADLDDAPDF